IAAACKKTGREPAARCGCQTAVPGAAPGRGRSGLIVAYLGPPRRTRRNRNKDRRRRPNDCRAAVFSCRPHRQLMDTRSYRRGVTCAVVSEEPVPPPWFCVPVRLGRLPLRGDAADLEMPLMFPPWTEPDLATTMTLGIGGAILAVLGLAGIGRRSRRWSLAAL